MSEFVSAILRNKWDFYHGLFLIALFGCFEYVWPGNYFKYMAWTVIVALAFYLFTIWWRPTADLEGAATRRQAA